jgi:hypothetical protein
MPAAPRGAKALAYYCYCTPLSCYLEPWLSQQSRLSVIIVLLIFESRFVPALILSCLSHLQVRLLFHIRP